MKPVRTGTPAETGAFTRRHDDSTEAPPAPDSPRRTDILSVVIPAYNEVENIEPLWDAVHAALSPLRLKWELVLVDDGSTDGTLSRMLALRRGRSEVRVLRIRERSGQSAAFWCGFRAARGDVIVTLDADLQNDPRDIPALVAALGEADVAIGWRRERRDNFVRRSSSRIANAIRNTITRESVHDTGCSLKAFRRHVIPAMFPFRGMHRFYPTLCRLAGFKVVEVSVGHHPRLRGKAKYGVWNRLFGPLIDCLAVRWMSRRYIGSVSSEEVRDEDPA